LQVNRIFRDIILGSPLIQHRIELFAAGFEYNAATSVSIADSREALLKSTLGLESLRPTETRVVENLRTGPTVTKTSGGVYAIMQDSVRMFTLGSALRGTPYKEWEIPLPIAGPVDFAFYPGADAIAFVERRNLMCVH
jgi:hypothetical protein